MKIVIQNKEHNLTLETMENAYVEDGELVESGQFTGMNNRKAITAMIDWLEENNLGKRRVNYRYVIGSSPVNVIGVLQFLLFIALIAVKFSFLKNNYL